MRRVCTGSRDIQGTDWQQNLAVHQVMLPLLLYGAVTGRRLSGQGLHFPAPPLHLNMSPLFPKERAWTRCLSLSGWGFSEVRISISTLFSFFQLEAEDSEVLGNSGD